MKTAQRVLALGAVMTLVSLVAASASAAKSPGINGTIAFDRNQGEALLTIEPDGTRETKLFDFHCCPKWSPDGTRIASPDLTDDGRFTSAIFDSDGSNYVRLPMPDPTLNADGGVWSPDGEWLAVGGWDDTDPSRNGLYRRQASGEGPLVRLTSSPRGDHDQPGDFSPDGKRIVVIRAHPVRDVPAIFVVGTDGSNLRQVTPWGMAGCCTASWSPDGRWILFDTDGRLYVVHPDGSGMHQVKIHVQGRSFAYEAAWSPDGMRIVFSLYVVDRGRADLFTAAADGSDLQQVTDTPEQEGQADWGPRPR
jgi:Tol biopolymer transport system component